MVILAGLHVVSLDVSDEFPSSGVCVIHKISVNRTIYWFWPFIRKNTAIFIQGWNLGWCNIRTFGIFKAHWFWITRKLFKILKATGMQFCQYDSFLFFLAWEKNFRSELCILPVLAQNQHIWNFHVYLMASNNRKLISHFRNP